MVEWMLNAFKCPHGFVENYKDCVYQDRDECAKCKCGQNIAVLVVRLVRHANAFKGKLVVSCRILSAVLRRHLDFIRSRVFRNVQPLGVIYIEIESVFRAHIFTEGITILHHVDDPNALALVKRIVQDVEG